MAMTIHNLAAFDAGVRAVCPAIDGVSGDGTIMFSAAAAPAQIAAANAFAATYVDAAPKIVTVDALLAALTDAEYVNIMSAAQTQLASKPALHRFMFSGQTIDLSKPAVQSFIQAIVTAGILTAARAAVVFVAPPTPAPPPLAGP